MAFVLLPFFFPLPCLAFLHLSRQTYRIGSMILDGVTPQPDPVDSESGWKEKSIEEDHGVSPRYADPFGDEENAEVKYKTMEWW